MSIKVVRDLSGAMKHRVHVREHSFLVDVDAATGGEDAGPSPHDLYDSALGACKALTMLMYARRKNIPVENIEVTIERDDSQESKGIYRLKALVSLTGDLTDAQRDDLLRIAGKCPLHKLMTQATTEVETVFA
jgi:putative redox protein